MYKNMLIIISGPSGVGKNSIITYLQENKLFPAETIVSHTTCQKQNYEIDGIHYNFMTKDDFKHLRINDEFLTYEKIHGNYYGVLRKTMSEALNANHAIFNIHPSWHRKIKDAISNTISIFILPTDMFVLENRLKKRGCELDDIKRKMGDAQSIMSYAPLYDNYIVNTDNNIEESAQNIKQILLSRFDTFDLSHVKADFYNKVKIKIFSELNIVNPYDHLMTLHNHCNKFKNIPIEEIRLEPIIGWSNISFKCSFFGESYALRIPRPKATLIELFTNEAENTQAVFQHLNITAELVYYDSSRLQVTKFIENSTLITPSNIDDLCIVNISKLLAKLHTLDANKTFKNKANPKGMMRKIFETINFDNIDWLPKDFFAIYNKILLHFDKYEKLSFVTVSCHMDTTPYNFLLVQMNEIKLIDWELSGEYYPEWDLANFSTQAKLSENKESIFINNYIKEVEKYTTNVDNILTKNYLSTRITILKPIIEFWLSLYIIYQKHINNSTISENDLKFYFEYRFNKSKELLDSPLFRKAISEITMIKNVIASSSKHLMFVDKSSTRIITSLTDNFDAPTTIAKCPE